MDKTEDAMELWRYVNASCMSDEETGKKVFRTVPWRSEQLDDLIPSIYEFAY